MLTYILLFLWIRNGGDTLHHGTDICARRFCVKNTGDTSFVNSYHHSFMLVTQKNFKANTKTILGMVVPFSYKRSLSIHEIALHYYIELLFAHEIKLSPQ